jgi:endonuclease/exonuclease/phosphatase family metal-dependent hydrolase
VLGLVTAEALRMSGPLLDRVVAEGGVWPAAVTALIVFALPVLLGAVVGAVGARRAASLCVVALVVLRLAAQATPTFGVGVATVVVALGALVLVLRQAAGDGPVRAVIGLVLGGAVDVALRTVLLTWDPVWRPGIVAWLIVLAECAALLVTMVLARPLLHADPHPVGRVGLLGGYLALSLLVLGSPGFVASASGLGLGYAGAVLLVGTVFAVEALSRSALPGGSGRWPDSRGYGAAVLLVGGVTAAILLTGVFAAVAVLFAQVGAALALARLLTPRRVAGGEPDDAMDPAELAAAEKLDQPASADANDKIGDLRLRRIRRRSAAGFAVAGLTAGMSYVLVVLYQVHYQVPLPFPNQVLPIAAALLVVPALGVRPFTPVSPDAHGGRDAERAARRGKLAPLAVLPAVLLMAPVAMLATTPAPAAPPTGKTDSVRLVSWNIHYARNADGVIDPETIAATIEKQHPDVVMLQEVSRGLPIGGTLDGAEWFSRRLAMPYVYAPAADEQFGNLILSRVRITKAATGSYAKATIELESGRTLDLYDIHLAHDDQTPTRLAQLKPLLDTWHSAAPAVIAGDLNAGPGSREVARLHDAGLVSAQDTTGHGGLLTSPTYRPAHRVDWIFGTPDLSFTDFAVPRTTASDHFPLAVTVRLG